MLDGKLLIDFISRIANEHHLQLEETKLRKIQEEAVEYYDYYGFNIFPMMGEMEELMKQEEKKNKSRMGTASRQMAARL